LPISLDFFVIPSSSFSDSSLVGFLDLWVVQAIQRHDVSIATRSRSKEVRGEKIRKLRAESLGLHHRHMETKDEILIKETMSERKRER
jgi:hypothetical protein